MTNIKRRIMKRFSTQLLSLILVLAMLFSISSISAAATNNDTRTYEPLLEEIAAQLDTYDEAEVAREAYNNLSPEAKAIFEQMLAIDPNTRAYHIENVDDSFSVASGVMQIAPFATSAVSLTSIVSQLTALGLPTAVIYSLEAVGAGIIAALADGPLPFGDMLLMVATLGAMVVIAANWSTVSGKWTSIVNIFTNAFTSISTTIKDVFAVIKSEVPTIQSVPSISIINNNTVVLGGVTYNCQVKISAMSSAQKQNDYYLAFRSGGDVLFDPNKPINANLARLVVALNNTYVGVVATDQSRAISIALLNFRGPEVSMGGAPGYYWHYHNLS